MRKSKFAFLLFIIFVQSFPSVVECSEKLEIFYSYGVGEKSKLDTKAHVLVFDMVCAKPIQVKFKLSRDEREKIMAALEANQIFDIKKNSFTENCDNKNGDCFFITPQSSETLEIVLGTKNIRFKYVANYIHPNDPDFLRYQKVTTLLKEFILNKREEHKVPWPKCGYL